MDNPLSEGWMTVDEAATKYGYSQTYLWKLCKSGVITSTMLKRVRLIKEDSLQAYMDAKRGPYQKDTPE